MLTVILFLIIAWLSTVGSPVKDAELSAREARFAEAEAFEQVRDIVLGRCSMCHAAEPVWDGIAQAPKAVHLETDAQIAARAREIYVQAGLSHAMPPGNVSWMEPDERAEIVAWYRAVTQGE